MPTEDCLCTFSSSSRCNKEKFDTIRKEILRKSLYLPDLYFVTFLISSLSHALLNNPNLKEEEVWWWGRFRVLGSAVTVSAARDA